MADSILNVWIFRVCIYSVIPTGSDYNVTALNVTMRAGETRATFSVGIIDDEVVERRESFQCTVSKINTPFQYIPIEWDHVPATVIIDEYLDFDSVFLTNYYTAVPENVSLVPITIESRVIAAFEYTVDLHVDNDGTAAEGMLQPPKHCIYFIYQPLFLMSCTNE